jgi:hypothetical protein
VEELSFKPVSWIVGPLVSVWDGDIEDSSKLRWDCSAMEVTGCFHVESTPIVGELAVVDTRHDLNGEMRRISCNL